MNPDLVQRPRRVEPGFPARPVLFCMVRRQFREKSLRPPQCCDSWCTDRQPIDDRTSSNTLHPGQSLTAPDPSQFACG